ncbi:hypothetical protein FBUS_06720 [Fasciolopsis buskii]|uniref:Uncharacterized protein n=1 Tax=Fasciolopsis buskii TaxID=27845 RepID=A0A8E0VRW8_9TREM|nr:hypothetical protein FBUS_06720 [Fasciolopsis buski]
MHSFAENLEHSINPPSPAQINAQSVLEALCDGNPQAITFMKKYNDLKLRKYDPD